MKKGKRFLAKVLAAFMLVQSIFTAGAGVMTSYADEEVITLTGEDLARMAVQKISTKPYYSLQWNLRGGPNSYDCSGFLSSCLKDLGLTWCDSGVNPNLANYGRTGNYFYRPDNTPWDTGDYREWFYTLSPGQVITLSGTNPAGQRVQMKMKVAAINAEDNTAFYAKPGSIIINNPPRDGSGTMGHCNISLGNLGTSNQDQARAILEAKYGVSLAGVTNGTSPIPVVIDKGTGYTNWRAGACSVASGCYIDNDIHGKNVTSFTGLFLEPEDEPTEVTFKKDVRTSGGVIVESNVAGAQYAVYSDKATADAVAASGSTAGTNPVKTFTTTTDGIKVTFMQKGTYYAAETKAPSGYVRSTTSVKFEVVKGNVVNLTDGTVELPDGSVIVTKKDKNTGAKLAGASFMIQEWSKSKNAYKDIVALSDPDNNGIYDTIGTYTMQCGSKITNGRLCYSSDNEGKFRIYEKAAPANYVSTGWEKEFNITSGSNRFAYDVENTALVTVKVIKKDDAGQPVKNVKFNLYYDGQDHFFTTGSDGLASWDNILEGKKVRLFEVSAPEQYQMNSEYVNGKVITVTKDSGTFVMELETVTNDRLGKIKIEKTVTQSGKSLGGAVYTIYTDKECTKVAVDEYGEKQENLMTGIDGTAGSVTSGYLMHGTYYVKEVKVPKNFLLDTKVHKVVVEGGVTTPVTVEHVTNEYDEVEMALLKTDADAGTSVPVEGAEYQLYNDVDTVDVNSGDVIPAGTLLYQGKTDVHGVIKVTEINQGKYAGHRLSNGKYHFVEVAAAEGYVLDDAAITVDASWDNGKHRENITVNASDKRQRVEMSLVKTDSLTKEPVEGAVYRLYNDTDIIDINSHETIKAGTVLFVGRTDKNGKIETD